MMITNAAEDQVRPVNLGLEVFFQPDLESDRGCTTVVGAAIATLNSSSLRHQLYVNDLATQGGKERFVYLQSGPYPDIAHVSHTELCSNSL